MALIQLTSNKYGSINNVLREPREYIEMFSASGLIVFREIRATDEEQQSLLKTIGDALGWYPNSNTDLISHSYTESHSESIKMRTLEGVDASSTDSTLLSWHIERVGSANPQVAAAWNMKTFTCDSNSGNTLFYDCMKLFSEMDEEDKNFLRLSQVSGPTEDGRAMSGVVRGAVIEHPWLHLPVVRICPATQEFQELVLFESRKPTATEKTRFNKLKSEIIYKITKDTKKQIRLKWSEGDLLIVDLIRMAHAVAGGFHPGQRIFTGQWCYLQHPTNY